MPLQAGVTFAEKTGIPIVVKNNGCTTQGIGAEVLAFSDGLTGVVWVGGAGRGGNKPLRP